MRTCRLCGAITDSPWRHCLKCFESLPPKKESMKSCLLCGATAESDAATCGGCGEGSWSVKADAVKPAKDLGTADTEPAADEDDVVTTRKSDWDYGRIGLRDEGVPVAEPEPARRYSPPPAPKHKPKGKPRR